MLKKNILFLLLTSFVFSNEENKELIEVNNSFITKTEYGKMLYNNPRGIGCSSCHGKKAQGRKLISFKHEYRKKEYTCELEVPNITNIDYISFYTKINSKKNPKKKFNKDEVCQKLIYNSNIMPTYFLVKDEIDAIYRYVKSLNK